MDLLEVEKQRPEPDRRKRRAVVVALLLILALAAGLRFANIGHTLTWDEAWNVSAVMDGAGGHTADPLFDNFYQHPPAYDGVGMAVAWTSGAGRQAVATAMEVISILFGLGVVLMLFFAGRDWFGVGAGLAAAFVFAVMPASRTFDAWIKQESMMLFFCLLMLFLFFRRRFVLSGIFLGAALLTKETAVFVAAPLALFVLLFRRPRMVRGLAITVALGAVLSGWWYLFLSHSKGAFFDFFIGRGQEATVWRAPWSYYLGRLPNDLGLLALALGALGLVLFCVRFRAMGKEAPGENGYRPRDLLVFVLLWTGIAYVVLTFSHGKPPWMVYAALPALALFAGWGAAEAYELARARGRAPAVSLAVAAVLVVALTFTLVPGGYAVGAKWLTDRARLDRQIAQYINAKKGESARVMLYSCDVSPTLMYYLDSYEPESITILTGDPTKVNYPITNLAVYLVYADQTGMDAVMDAYFLEPDYMILFTRPWKPVPQLANVEQARLECLRLTKPVVIGGAAALFDGAQLRKEVARQVLGNGI